jgi:hypothetical protein
VPRASGQVRNMDVTIMQHDGRCPDVSGPAGALRRGHEAKKDTSMPMGLNKGGYFASSRGRDSFSKNYIITIFLFLTKVFEEENETKR